MLVFISNFLSPHTEPFLSELSAFMDDIVAVNMMKITEERLRLGYNKRNSNIKTISYSEDEEYCQAIINDAEFVILANDDVSLIEYRMESNKLTFVLHERLFKKGPVKWLDPRLWALIKSFRAYQDKELYLLAIGKFAAADFRRIGFNPQKILRFGYFPETDRAGNPSRKPEHEKTEILWVGRYVSFKRPLMALKIMERLPESFHLTMVGDGKHFKKAQEYAKKRKINVTIAGILSNDEVRKRMKEADVFLSTSDQGEGWGAVINEAMNYSCAIVSSDKIGCAETLVDSSCGMIFKSDSIQDAVRCILEAASKKEQLGENAYRRITALYNEQTAAQRLYEILKSKNTRLFHDNGPCSIAYTE